MSHVKSLLAKIKSNLLEIYLGLLLFLALPLVLAIFFGWKAFIASTVLFQIAVVILYVRKQS